MRIVFFGTPAFAVPSLRALLADPELEVAAVVTQPDREVGRGRRVSAPPVKRLAEEAGITLWQPSRLPAIKAELRALEPDVAVVVAFGRIFRRWLLELPRHGCINVHASALPRLRGPAPIRWAVIRGEAETGVSIMRLEPGVDTGPVCALRRTPVGERETAEALGERLAKQGAEARGESKHALRRGDAVFEAQDESLSTHGPMLTKEDGLLDWTRPAAELERLVRGTTPWPGAWCPHERGPLKLLESEGVPDAAGEPGTLLAAKGPRGAPVVACGAGGLALLRVQPAGRKAMDGAAARNGRILVSGQSLGTDGPPEPVQSPNG